jgi:hypothetical protein
MEENQNAKAKVDIRLPIFIIKNAEKQCLI